MVESNLYLHLLVHLKPHIEKEKAFACDICSKKYLRKSSLTRHKLTHNLTTFECTVCLKKFAKKSNLTRHSTTHEIKTSEEKFQKKRVTQEVCSPESSKNCVNTNSAEHHLNIGNNNNVTLNFFI